MCVGGESRDDEEADDGDAVAQAPFAEQAAMRMRAFAGGRLAMVLRRAIGRSERDFGPRICREGERRRGEQQLQQQRKNGEDRGERV